MAFSLERFASLRPFLYHLTASQNVSLIRESMILRCTKDILCDSSHTDLVRTKRIEEVLANFHEQVVHVRDQRPLHPGHISFEDGWTFSDLVEDLNSRVFFWPGKDSGPNDYGIRHFERYAGENPVILRMNFEDALEVNESEPTFSKYNSGSPRCNQGSPIPRGPETFSTAPNTDFTVSKVVEVSFTKAMNMPFSTEIGDCPFGPWKSLLPES